MASEKAIYWTALGVMALLFGNSLAVRQHEVGDRLAHRALAAVEQLSSEITSQMDAAIMALNQTGNPSAYSTVAAARVQARLAAVQGKLACAEARLARRQAQQTRVMALAQVRKVVVVCPRPSLPPNPPRPVVALDRDSI
jgi:hypothetical protein